MYMTVRATSGRNDVIAEVATRYYRYTRLSVRPGLLAPYSAHTFFPSAAGYIRVAWFLSCTHHRRLRYTHGVSWAHRYVRTK